ncbi:MAG TPA: hypothetical protein VF111_13980 [Thermoanaerobaculia bacterium]
MKRDRLDTMLVADGLVAAGQERCVLNPAPQRVSFAIHQIAAVVAPNNGGTRQSRRPRIDTN